MTIEKAIEILEEVKELDDSIYSFDEEYMTALNTLIEFAKGETE